MCCELESLTCEEYGEVWWFGGGGGDGDSGDPGAAGGGGDATLSFYSDLLGTFTHKHTHSQPIHRQNAKAHINAGISTHYTSPRHNEEQSEI